ncbi:MAG TPA: chorismate mutase [Gemmatimonadales bacterium]|nr:chorismate mutase [Gemmatimonadales bacterium]
MRADATARLDGLRAAIARLDESLVSLLAERVALAREVGAVKRGAGLPRLDPAREAAVVRQASSLARGAGLEEEEVREILWRVVGLCRRAQEEG